MQISSSDLINLPVYTENGRNLGRIDAFDIDVDSGLITKYYVKTGLIKGLWHQRLMIDKSEVVSVSKEKMIVKDNVYREPVRKFKAAGMVS